MLDLFVLDFKILKFARLLCCWLFGKNEQQINLLITAYAASGLIIAKMGNLAKAKVISEEVQEIDEKNDLAKILFDIITRPPDEDED